MTIAAGDRAPLRALRRPVRPRDADAGARGARGGLDRGAQGPRLRRRADGLLARLRRAPDAALPRRAHERGRRAARSGSSARTCCTPARTSSTTRSGRRCSPGAWASSGSSPRPGAGQHGVGIATACALLGLECVVYMGAEDMRRQQPNVQRMRLLGTEVRAVEAGTRTLKEATSEAIRDWVTNVATTHYVIGSAIGPAPVSGDRPRPSARDRRRGARPAARARGTPARPRRRLRRRRLERDRHVHGVRRRRRASRCSASRPPARASRPVATARR